MRRVALVGAAVACVGTARADKSLIRIDPHTLPGWSLYDRFCVACHGAIGDGLGPAAPWLEPAPRDFTRGVFAWRSRDAGDAASRDDVADTIRWGAPGTSMPAFGGALSAAQLDQLVDVVAALAPEGSIDARGRGPHASFVTTDGDDQRGGELWHRLGCASCHGDAGRGDGPAAAKLVDSAGEPHPPYDLTRAPLRRPRPSDAQAATDQAIADSIRYGVDGTAMPGSPRISPADLGELVAWVDTLRAHDAAPANAPPLDPRAIARDTVVAGHWPGRAAPDDAAPFAGAIDPQGPPPASLAPAEASLSRLQCARCHAKQAREWDGTIHAQATAPGVIAQLPSMEPREVAACQRCHAPLAEQIADEDLRAQGVTCAACHVRGWRRHGPPGVSASLLRDPAYPLDTAPIYERSDFCLPCHQLPARTAVAGRPLLDTYREWLLGPYLPRGVQCQHCHMPNREHTWKGVHDPDTFRQGIRVDAIARRMHDGAVDVRARVANVGAGHFLPTTTTPAAWLRIELVDGAGRPIAGARAELRIGRALEFTAGGWKQLEDTRIPPGEARELAGAWAGGRVADAAAARVIVEVHPDDYYEGFYRTKLAAHPSPSGEVRAQYEAALARALGSHYVAYQRDVPLR